MQAMRLDRINEVLNQKVGKYKHECAIQEDDREFLVRQLVAIKKENSRLRREIEKIKSVCSYQDTLSLRCAGWGTGDAHYNGGVCNVTKIAGGNWTDT